MSDSTELGENMQVKANLAFMAKTIALVAIKLNLGQKIILNNAKKYRIADGK